MNLWMKSLSVANQMKATEQYFLVAPFVRLYTVVTLSESNVTYDGSHFKFVNKIYSKLKLLSSNFLENFSLPNFPFKIQERQQTSFLNV